MTNAVNGHLPFDAFLMMIYMPQAVHSSVPAGAFSASVSTRSSYHRDGQRLDSQQSDRLSFTRLHAHVVRRKVKDGPLHLLLLSFYIQKMKEHSFVEHKGSWLESTGQFPV